LLLRIAVIAFFAITEGIIFVIIAGILAILVIAMTAIIRPYRESVYNVVDLVLFLAIIQVCFSIIGITIRTVDQSFTFVAAMCSIGIIIPLAYIILLAVYKILPNICIVHIKELVVRLFCFQQPTLYRRER
jgi:hypothetical protein